MAIDSWELVQVTSQFVTADFIIWKKYRRKALGMVEAMLDANPQLSFVHRTTPFIPVGTYVRVPIDSSLLLGKPQVLPQNALWTDKAGYTL